MLNGIAVVVTVVWAVATLADVMSEAYTVDAGLHLVAGGAVGGIFGIQVARKR